MSGRVIQGFFAGGQPPLSLQTPSLQTAAHRPAAPAAVPRLHAPPGVAPASSVAAQRKPAGAPIQTPTQPRQGMTPQATTSHSQPLQAHGTSRSFAVDPQQIGLVRSGGKPLPPSILAKMEAAFGTDFSAVRIHEGPQAARIGALAFTTGTDIYFAPGRYQPETLQGQQLLGHELTHVVQQRQGRVRAPSGSGLSVVQDAMLEAEADRMGMRAGSSTVSVRSGILQKSNQRGLDVIQRGGCMSRPRLTHATCVLNGSQHDDGKSFASVTARATHLLEGDRCVYEMAWDAAVAPVGHAGFQAVGVQVLEGVASPGFIVDRSQTGEAVGEMDQFYKETQGDGRCFEFRDGIEWPEILQGGRWRFRLIVLSSSNNEVARSQEAVVDWDKPTKAA
ncbi:MAG: hypothetical protein RLY86_3896 [Pseudomonadota bacterium]|jgi:hypothetical protein